MKKLKTIFKKNIVTTKTPLRISFAGGGTDMPYFYSKFNGITVSTSIDKFVYVTVKKHNNFKEKFRLNYSDTEILDNINKIKNLRIRETLKYFRVNEPIYISTISDLPYNTGLGSSSAFLVGLINAIFLIKGEKKSLNTIAEIAFKIENMITNNSLGKQDHYIAAYGDLRKILYKSNIIDVAKITIMKKNLDFLNKNMLFFWTGKSRLSNKNLDSQKKNFKKNLDNLKYLKLIANKFNNELKLKKLNLKKLGSLLDENWQIKQKFTKNISSNYLNTIYKNAISNGCYGGKLLGAGGGGFFIFICKKKLHKKIIDKIHNCRHVNFKFYNQGTKKCYLD
jgi:D-glycero-alpha-D-manno-heptose-7-phosphate kinase